MNTDTVEITADSNLWELYRYDHKVLLGLKALSELSRKEAAQSLYIYFESMPGGTLYISMKRLRERLAIGSPVKLQNSIIRRAMAELEKIGYIDYTELNKVVRSSLSSAAARLSFRRYPVTDFSKCIHFHEVNAKSIYFHASRFPNVHPYRQHALSGPCFHEGSSSGLYFHDDPAVKVSTFMNGAKMGARFHESGYLSKGEQCLCMKVDTFRVVFRDFSMKVDTLSGTRITGRPYSRE